MVELDLKYKIRSVLLAESLRQELSGQQSLIGIFTGTMGAESAPLALPQVVIRIEIESNKTSKAKFVFKILTPSQVALFNQSGDVSVNKDNVNIIGITFAPFIVTEQGEYKIHFGIEGRDEHIGSFRVQFGKRPETQINH
jgi:hypothetical protein